MNHLKLLFLLLVDTIIILTVIFISWFLVSTSKITPSEQNIIFSLTVLISHHIFSFLYRLYKKAWEYASIRELFVIFKIVTASIATTAIIQLLFFQNINLRLLTVTWLLYTMFIGGSRFCWRLYRDSFIKSTVNKKRTLIIGAGSAGTMVARQLINGTTTDLLPVAFIDDSYNKQKLDILGIPVKGRSEDIKQIVKAFSIEHIIIAIPSLNKQALNAIVQECAKTEARTQILPMLEDLLT
ncbi:MAG: nucleoside-diphosphate sugar epimerase/dehydratase, partial [Bacilli bacterium]